MPRINDLVKKRSRKLLRPRTELPTWWGLALGVVGVVLGLWVAWGLISATPEQTVNVEATTPTAIATVPAAVTPVVETTTTPATGPGTTSPTTPAAVTATTTSNTATPTTTTTAAGELVEIATNAGGVAKVPAAVITAAGNAALSSASGTDAVIVETTLRTAPVAGSNVWYLDVRIDPDGASAAPTIVVKLRCYPIGDGWAVEAA